MRKRKLRRQFSSGEARLWIRLICDSSGLEVYTTCSKHNFDYVKSLGADHVFDYKSPTCGADIRKASNNKIYYAWDTIGEGNSAQICADGMSSDTAMPSGQKLQYANILSAKFPREEVESKRTLMYSIMGEDFAKGGRKIPAKKEDFEFMKKFVAISQKLIDEGKLKPHNLDVRPGGLEGILQGLEDMKNGKVSGKKLVYKL
jgi:NADPH:quinone reductase-like Zn-dependent oxidoreductase